MGFLSKLFGGDAEASRDSDVEDASGSEGQPKSSVSVRPPPPEPEPRSLEPDGETTDRAVPAVKAPPRAAALELGKPAPFESELDAVLGTDKRSPGVSSSQGSAATDPFKARRDRRSPGFYSSVSSAAVTGPKDQRKATMMGVAPPAPLAAGKAAKVEKEEKPRPATRKNNAPFASGATRAAPPPSKQAVARSGAGPHSPVAAPPSSMGVAREEESEKTNPGLGNSRSRHDPDLLLELPEADLDLLGEFVLDVALGPASERWLDPVRAAVTRLRAAAQAAQRSELDQALELFEKALDHDGEVSGECRQVLLQRFVAVDVALPRPFDIAEQKAERERLIVGQLVAQVTQMHPLLKTRLSEEGFTSLDRFVGVKPDDLAARLEATREQAEQLVSTFQGYMLERCERGPDVALQGRTEALTERLERLEQSAAEFQTAADDGDAAAKRKARRQRQSRVAQVNLLLAELGETQLLDDLERCSVDSRIERLRRWLDESTGSP